MTLCRGRLLKQFFNLPLIATGFMFALIINILISQRGYSNVYGTPKNQLNQVVVITQESIKSHHVEFQEEIKKQVFVSLNTSRIRDKSIKQQLDINQLLPNIATEKQKDILNLDGNVESNPEFELQKFDIKKFHQNAESAKKEEGKHEGNVESNLDFDIDSIAMDPDNSSRFFKLSPQQIPDFPKPTYIANSKNPCFYADITSISYLSAEEKKQKHRLTCFPLVYVFGSEKAGSTDFHTKLVQHQHVIDGIDKEGHYWNINRPDKVSWYIMSFYTEMYQYVASLIDNCCLNPSKTCHADQFSTSIKNKEHVYPNKAKAWRAINKKVETFPYKELKSLVLNEGGQCPLITVDSTVRSVYDGMMWERDPHNKGLAEPKILTAERLRHFVPNAKTILLMREPVARLVSDYRFFVDSGNAEKFHQLVVTGIDWWNQCINKLSLRQCAFGLTYKQYGLPDLPPSMGWGTNGAARIRIGFYIIYIRRWLETFPRDQVLLLNVNTMDIDPLKVMNEHVYPFLELEPLSQTAEKNIVSLYQKGHLHKTKRQMTPRNETIQLLRKLYEPYNRQLADFTGDDSYLSW